MEIKEEENNRYKTQIRHTLKLGKSEGMSEKEWREYKKWANDKLKLSNPLGFEEKNE